MHENNNPSLRVLVIGGAGYVGTALSYLYQRQGIDFAILDIFDGSLTSIAQCESRGWSYIQCDILNQAKLDRAIADYNPTHVVHLAALHFIPFCNTHPTETVRVNVTGLSNVIQAINVNNPSINLLFASSAAVYDSKPSPLNEDDQLCPTDVYGLTKYAGEKLIAERALHYKIARLFNVCGRHDSHEHLLPKVYRHATTVKGEPLQLGSRDTKRDYIHVDDVASALFAIQVSSSQKQIFNVGNGRAYSVEEAVSLVLQHAASTQEVIYQQQQYLRKDDKAFLCSDSSLIRNETGWAPVHDLEASVRTLV